VREKITTGLDLGGSALLITGVAVLAGLGWALVAAGMVALGISWGLSGRPVPKRGES
jgi:hypothetical protein